MKKSLRVPTVALLTLLAGCGGVGVEREEPSVRGGEILIVPLEATRYNAGRIGQAVLVSRGDETTVTLQISGVPAYVTRPVHLHTYIHDGVCGAMNPRPAYALTDRVLASSMASPMAIAAFRGPATLTNVASVSLTKLRETPHAIDVRTGPPDGSRSIFCGTITGSAGAPRS